MSFTIGLTGSIGMGKSTTAQIFADLGIPVWDADSAVHRLYAPGGPGAKAVAEDYPDAIAPDGSVSRPRLRAMIAANPSVMDQLNALIHPLVAQDRARFLSECTSEIAVLDVPLLFETGAEDQFDLVVVVSAPQEVQRERVLARGMSEDEFQMILARQMPDAEKRARADVVIETTSLEETRQEVQSLVSDIRAGKYDEKR